MNALLPSTGTGRQRIQVKNAGYSVGELRAYAELTKERASTAQKMTKNRRVKENGAHPVT